MVRVIATVLAIAATASFAEPADRTLPQHAQLSLSRGLRAVAASAETAQPARRAPAAARRAAPSETADADLTPYEGLATWVDVHDDAVYRRPEAAVAAMRRRGVRTLYLETAHYNTTTAIHRPRVVSRLIDAAHAEGIHVVAWYLPSFTDVARDLRRSMAAIRFTSARGRRFDAFALDIEAPVVRDVAVRNRRMLRLSGLIRDKVGPAYALGAIVPEAGAAYWPRFPYREVARHYDVFLPMAYHSFRVRGAADVAGYVRRNVAAVRRGAGDPTMPVHMIGGIADDIPRREVRAFVRESRRRRTIGVSLYDFATTGPATWQELQRAAP